jgi:hypothetical protein
MFHIGIDGQDYCVIDLCGVRTECKGQIDRCQNESALKPKSEY